MLHAFRRFNQIDLQKSQKIPHLIKFWLLNVQENKKNLKFEVWEDESFRDNFSYVLVPILATSLPMC